MRMLLVSPNDFATTYGDLRHVSHLTGDIGRLLNVALPTIAALTPREIEVRIVDENAEPLDFEERYDVVGITGFPPQVYRAREIADRFRARGATIICGGTSVSLSPERWRDFADVLVIGEAERTWPRVCADLLGGRVEPEYRELERPDLSLAPLPDYRGFRPEALARFHGGIVQTSRGCPFECEFCDAIVFAGRKMRVKPVARIVEELDQLAAMGMRHVYLADDNFGAHRRKAKEILIAIRDWNRRRARPMPLLTQLTVDVADDEELLALAAEAGLTRVFIGLETPNEASLLEAKKKQNVRTDMRAGVRRFQEHGVEVLGGSVVGFDHDDRSIFGRQLAFFHEIGVASVQVYPLNAPDGTPLKARMEREGRYVDWSRSSAAGTKHFSYFNSYTVVPAQMSVEELQQGVYWLLARLYEPRRFAARFGRFLDVYDRAARRPHRESAIEGSAPLPPGGVGGGDDEPSALPPHRTEEPSPRAAPSALADAWRILRHDRAGLALLARIVRALATEGDRDEALAFARMVLRAARSRHPQRFSFAVGDFLTLINTRRMLRAHAPGLADTPYPSGPTPPPPPLDRVRLPVVTR